MKYIPRMRNNNIKLRVATQKNVEKKKKQNIEFFWENYFSKAIFIILVFYHSI